MIPLLPRWNLRPNRPSFYDTDSGTILELASTLHKTMNSLIEDYNKFVDNVNNTITEFTTESEQDRETFEIAIRQEFQDFIDVVDLKITGLNNDYKTFTNQVNNSISSQDNKIDGMIANQVPITQSIINDAVREAKIAIISSYDEETESLNIVASGGV